MSKQWLKNGKRLIDADGKRILCSECPCFSCAETIKVTFVGVDAGVCTACCAAFGASTKATSVTLDGVYTATKVSETDTRCNYSVSGGSYKIKKYTNATCAGKSTELTYNTTIEVAVSPITGNVFRVYVSSTNTGISWSFGSAQATPGGIPDIDVAFGVLIPNALTCCVAQHLGTLLGLPASSGGTAKVEDV